VSASTARYFFDTVKDGVRTTDDIGLTLADRDAVRRQAVAALPEMAVDALPNGSSHDFSVEVRDEHGTRLFRAELSFRSHWLDRGD